LVWGKMATILMIPVGPAPMQIGEFALEEEMHMAVPGGVTALKNRVIPREPFIVFANLFESDLLFGVC
jgi:hypothetical protein